MSMSIELKQAAEKALVVLGSATSFMSRKARDQHESVVAELRAALSQQPATPEPVLFIHPSTFAMNNSHVGAWKPGHELPGYIPLYTHPAPSLPADVVRDAIATVREQYRGTNWGKDAECICDAIDAAMLAAKDKP